jgi:hypothetical protein
VVANIVNNDVEEEDIPKLDDKEKNEGPKTSHPGDTMKNSNEEEEELVTPRLELDEEKE